jgi:hypothetical protein
LNGRLVFLLLFYRGASLGQDGCARLSNLRL